MALKPDFLLPYVDLVDKGFGLVTAAGGQFDGNKTPVSD